MKLRHIALGTSVLWSFFDLASAASFDCAKAATAVERMICTDSELSGLDARMAADYQQLLRTVKNESEVRAEQRAWLARVRNKCSDVACLRTAYSDRISAIRPRAREESNLSPPQPPPSAHHLEKRVRVLDLPVSDRAAVVDLMRKIYKHAFEDKIRAWYVLETSQFINTKTGKVTTYDPPIHVLSVDLPRSVFGSQMVQGRFRNAMETMSQSGWQVREWTQEVNGERSAELERVTITPLEVAKVK